MKVLFIMLQLFCLIISLHATGVQEETPPDTISIYVSILPQVYFVEKIGGERVKVRELVPAGREPHVFEPGPKQMTELSKTDMYFTIGLPFEKILLPKIRTSFTNLQIVHTEKGITYRQMKHDHVSHDDDTDHEDEAETGSVDPHIWLGISEVKIQLKNILSALIAFDPHGKAYYESNYALFIQEIDLLYARLKKTLEPLKEKRFFVYHPAFGYFADEFGLEQFPIEIEGKEPGARQLTRIIDMVKKEKVKVIFVQQQFSRRNATIIAEHTGCVVIPIDPLKKEWLENMEEIAAKLEKGLKD
jgi:zinc transport system substrate-binding protein